MGGMLAEAMRGFRMTLRLGETVTGLDTDAGRVSAVVTDQTTVPTDLVILGLVVRPDLALAAGRLRHVPGVLGTAVTEICDV